MASRAPSVVAVFLLLLNALVLFATAQLALRCRAEAESGSRFERALDTAMSPGEEDVVRDLVPLAPDGTDLVWDRGADPARVLVATLTGYGGYADDVAGSCRLCANVWVSPVPQLRDRCRRFDRRGRPLRERLWQYLGLRPDGGADTVVELWIDPGDAFRPCPDPEVDDRTCRLGLPVVPSADAAGTEAGRRALDHARWFRSKFDAYYDDQPYPWTRLGYTFDWGGDATRIGASEYVVRDQSVVGVSSVMPADDYCTAADPPEREPSARPPAGEELPCC